MTDPNVEAVREACAKVCEKRAEQRFEEHGLAILIQADDDCAAAIRALDLSSFQPDSPREETPEFTILVADTGTGPERVVRLTDYDSLKRRLQEAQRERDDFKSALACEVRLGSEANDRIVSLRAERDAAVRELAAWKLLAEMNAALVKACEEDAAIRDALAEKGKP